VSVDLDIAPSQAKVIDWASLQRRWIQRLGAAGASMLGPNPQLCHLGKNAPVAEGERLDPPAHYYFTLAVPSSLSLSIMANADDLDESLYLEDYGRNVDPARISELAEKWRRVGHTYGISSLGGRSRSEPELFTALACALADLCDGHVIVMNDGVFDLGVGVYTPEQFSTAHWLRTG
jgi:hypothetical protein